MEKAKSEIYAEIISELKYWTGLVEYWIEDGYIDKESYLTRKINKAKSLIKSVKDD